MIEPPWLCLRMMCCATCAVKNAAVQVDVDDLLPGLVGDVDVVARQADARIDVRNVHSAKLADEILLQLVDLRLVGHVAVQRNDLHAVALGHLLAQRLEAFLRGGNVHQRDVRTRFRPSCRDVPANASAARPVTKPFLPFSENLSISR